MRAPLCPAPVDRRDAGNSPSRLEQLLLDCRNCARKLVPAGGLALKNGHNFPRYGGYPLEFRRTWKTMNSAYVHSNPLLRSAVVVAGSLLAGTLHAETFDLAAGFSPSRNPNGPWTYGWVGSVGGSFTPIRVQHLSHADGGEPTPSWQLTSFMTPAVYKNTNVTTITIGNGVGTLPPETIWYYPGEAGRPENFGVIRFT